jgi:hypothetical protein
MKATTLQLIRIALALLAAFNSSGAMAAQVAFQSDPGALTGAVAATIPVEKLGRIDIPHGQAELTGDKLSLTVIPEWQFDRQVVLSGIILHTEILNTPHDPAITGIVYFQDGAWLHYIVSPRSQEMVSTDTGTITGNIQTITSDSIQIAPSGKAPQTVALASARSIRSSRAYRFSIPLSSVRGLTAGQSFTSDAKRMTLTPTSTSQPLSSLKGDLKRNGDHDLSTSQLVGLDIGLSLVELGQLAPVLAVPLGSGPMRSNAFLKELQFNSAVSPGTQ